MIETGRLRLRGWREGDAAAFAAATNTPAVMAHLGGMQPPAHFVEMVLRRRAQEAAHGYCFWLVERRADDAVLGLCGLQPGTVGPIAGEVEIGWRLREDAWGKGYAREAAIASLAWGWDNLAVDRIRAITVPANAASWRLMERLGMTRRADLDFDHPLFAPGHPLCRHVVYEALRPQGGSTFTV